MNLPLLAVSALLSTLNPLLDQHMRARGIVNRDRELAAEGIIPFLEKRGCSRVTDGCNIAGGHRQRPPGRYVARGIPLSASSAQPRTALILAVEAPMESAGLVASRTLLACNRRHAWVCMEGSPPLEPEPPARTSAPVGADWIDVSEIHGSWISLSSPTNHIRCQPIDYSLLSPRKSGELSTRRRPLFSAQLCSGLL